MKHPLAVPSLAKHARARVVPPSEPCQYAELLPECWHYMATRFLPRARDRLALKLTCKASAVRDQAFRRHLLAGLARIRDLISPRAVRAWFEQELDRVVVAEDEDDDSVDPEYNVVLNADGLLSVDFDGFWRRRIGHPPRILAPDGQGDISLTFSCLIYHPSTARWFFQFPHDGQDVGFFARPGLVNTFLHSLPVFIYDFRRDQRPSYGQAMEVLLFHYCRVYLQYWLTDAERETLKRFRTTPGSRIPFRALHSDLILPLYARLWKPPLDPLPYSTISPEYDSHLRRLHEREALYAFLVKLQLQDWHYRIAFRYGYHSVTALGRGCMCSDPAYLALLEAMGPAAADTLDRALCPWLEVVCLQCQARLEHPVQYRELTCPACDRSFVDSWT